MNTFSTSTAVTTLRPNIGVMEYEDFRQITLADLPGLIEGAHQNAGLGYNFLRHVERTSLLMFIVDVGGFQLNERSPHRNAFETVMSLNKVATEEHSSRLRIILCVVTKTSSSVSVYITYLPRSQTSSIFLKPSHLLSVLLLYFQMDLFAGVGAV